MNYQTSYDILGTGFGELGKFDGILHYRYLHAYTSLVPSPTPSFSSLLSTVKRGGPGTFPTTPTFNFRSFYPFLPLMSLT